MFTVIKYYFNIKKTQVPVTFSRTQKHTQTYILKIGVIWPD